MGLPMGITGSLQWHQLEDRTVLKVSAKKMERWVKIGAPGYKIGGDVYMASVGLKIAF